ncbi:MAG: hypothetical protein HY335_00950 [Deinococcus sp.]|nr:hypothetical protein [Deinococcus sp.]
MVISAAALADFRKRLARAALDEVLADLAGIELAAGVSAGQIRRRLTSLVEAAVKAGILPRSSKPLEAIERALEANALLVEESQVGDT